MKKSAKERKWAATALKTMLDLAPGERESLLGQELAEVHWASNTLAFILYTVYREDSAKREQEMKLAARALICVSLQLGPAPGEEPVLLRLARKYGHSQQELCHESLDSYNQWVCSAEGRNWVNGLAEAIVAYYESTPEALIQETEKLRSQWTRILMEMQGNA